MSMQAWKVKLFVAIAPLEVLKKGHHAEHVDNFGIQAKNMDDARKEARAWLERRGHKVRSVNFTQVPRELIAYIAAKTEDAGPKKG